MGTWINRLTGLSPRRRSDRRDFWKEGVEEVVLLAALRHNENMEIKEMLAEQDSFEEWLAFGFARGWVGAPICYTHDGLPTTEQEDAEFEEHDPCIHILRLYEDAEMKRGVEENHSPSQWRASNRGMK